MKKRCAPLSIHVCSTMTSSRSAPKRGFGSTIRFLRGRCSSDRRFAWALACALCVSRCVNRCVSRARSPGDSAFEHEPLVARTTDEQAQNKRRRSVEHSDKTTNKPVNVTLYAVRDVRLRVLHIPRQSRYFLSEVLSPLRSSAHRTAMPHARTVEALTRR